VFRNINVYRSLARRSFSVSSKLLCDLRIDFMRLTIALSVDKPKAAHESADETVTAISNAID
jgi:hypothetical protein